GAPRTPPPKALRKRTAPLPPPQQTTRAMKVGPAAKPRRAQGAAERARPYAAKLAEMFTAVAAGIEPEAHPLLARRPEQRLDLLVLTSDRGPCGGFTPDPPPRPAGPPPPPAAARPGP